MRKTGKEGQCSKAVNMSTEDSSYFLTNRPPPPGLLPLPGENWAPGVLSLRVFLQMLVSHPA